MQHHDIPSSLLVRALAKRKASHHCENCGARMFVQYDSGLCPFCLSGHPPRRVHLGGVTHGGPFAPRPKQNHQRSVGHWVRRTFGATG